jgi:hypothetical protein
MSRNRRDKVRKSLNTSDQLGYFTIEDKQSALRKLKDSYVNKKSGVVFTKQEIRSMDYSFQYQLYKNSIVYFARDFLNMHLYPHMLKWIKFIEGNKYCLIKAPRFHGKSETIAHVYITHKIVFNKNIRVLFISSTMNSVSMKSLNQVRRELTGNKELVWFFGRQFNETKGIWVDGDYYFRMKDNLWTNEAFTVTRDMNLKEPTVTAIGIGTEVLGGHYDIIICDDMVTRKNSVTQKKRDDLKSWFTETVFPLLEHKEQSGLILIGTPKHYDDLYNTVETGGNFSVLTNKAIIEGDINDTNAYVYGKKENKNGGMEITVKFHDKNIRNQYKVLWERDKDTGDGYTIEDMLKLKYTMDSTDPGNFMKELQCSMVDDNISVFPAKLLEEAKDRSKTYFRNNTEFSKSDYQFLLQTWDLSIVDSREKAEKGDTDFTVGLTVGVDYKWNTHILNIFRNRGLSPSELKNKISELYERFLPIQVIIEDVAFQRFLVGELKAETDMPIYAHRTHYNKTQEQFGVIPSLRTQFDNNKIIFPYKKPVDKQITNTFINELYCYGVDRHDDLVMALWFAIYFIQTNEIIRKLRQRVTKKERPQRKERRKRER